MFNIDGPSLKTRVTWGVIVFSVLNLGLNLYKGVNHQVKVCLSWCRVTSFLVLGLYRHCFTISYTYEDNRSFMVRSDVVDVYDHG